MDFWSVLCLVLLSLAQPQVSNFGSSSALLLLYDLLHEHLVYRLSLSHVPRLVWYAFEYSMNQRQHSGLK